MQGPRARTIHPTPRHLSRDGPQEAPAVAGGWSRHDPSGGATLPMQRETSQVSESDDGCSRISKQRRKWCRSAPRTLTWRRGTISVSMSALYGCMAHECPFDGQTSYLPVDQLISLVFSGIPQRPTMMQMRMPATPKYASPWLMLKFTVSHGGVKLFHHSV